MKEWKTYRIGDICKTNKSQYSIKEAWDEFLYLDTGNITRNTIDEIARYSSAAELPSRARRKVICDDIIFSTVRPNQCHFGILSNPPTNLLVSTGFTVITANKEVVDPYYLYYYLSQDSIIDYLHSIGEQAVSAYPSIKSQDIEDLEIELPDLATQNNIAKTLRALDNKIELNRKINDNLEQQAQALYKSWFVDFEPFCEGEFIESSLGSIPAGWKVGQLSDICEIVGGGTPSKSHPEYYCKRGIAWITPKDLSVSKSKFSSRGSEDITSDGYKNSSAKLMPRGTVLFSSRAPIGYISIATNEICTNQGFKSAVPGIAGTGYLYYFLQANTDKIESKASGSTFKEASGSLMKALEVIIPADGIFNQFEAELAPILTKQENIASEIQTLTTLRDTLLPKLMSGELKINEIDC